MRFAHSNLESTHSNIEVLSQKHSPIVKSRNIIVFVKCIGKNAEKVSYRPANYNPPKNAIDTIIYINKKEPKTNLFLLK